MSETTRERVFQKAVISAWENAGFWAESVSVGSGMKTGFPDCVFHNGVEGWTLFSEMKFGDVDGDGVLRSRTIRPAQIRWARKANRFGVPVSLLCGYECWFGLCAAVIENPIWFRGDETIFYPGTYHAFSDLVQAVHFANRIAKDGQPDL